jgi:signal transduction histidine kinase
VGESVSDWPRFLSLAVHEFRTPVTVVAGYIRMLLKERAGPLEANQRRLLEEAEKSCGRISLLISEMSEVGQLLDGRQSLSTETSDLSSVLREVAANAPENTDQGRVVVTGADEPLLVSADGSRLRRVVESVVSALRREIIDGSDLVISAASRPKNDARVAWIAFGTPPVADALHEASADNLGPFDEWRGGCGLALPLARLIVEMHHGRLLALTGERQKAGGVLELPLA